MVNLRNRVPLSTLQIRDEVVSRLSRLDSGITLVEHAELLEIINELHDHLRFNCVERNTVLANLPSTADEAVTASQLFDKLNGLVTLADIRQICNDNAECIEKTKQATRYWLPVAVLCGEEVSNG